MEIPVVLGTTEVTPLELATAYLAFANLGTIPKPHFIEEVQNPNGLQLYRNVVEPKRVLESDVSSLMTQMLLGVMTHGSGRLTRSLLPQGLRHSAAGKSGTTNDNRDAWFVGYTPDYVVAVWVGFDRPLSLGEKRSGGQVAGPIWASFVSKLPVPEASAKPALELDARYQWVLLDLMTRLPAHGTEAGERLGWRIVGRPLERAPLAAVSPPGSY
jgi:membrane peptidoglycan carboxypeptidase